MEKLLYITANPKQTEASFSLRVGDAFLNAFKEAYPEDQIIECDLYDMDLPMIDGDVLNAWGKLQQGEGLNDLNSVEQQKVGRLNEVLEQFIDADKYVFVTPMWNLSLPPMVKAYIDAVMVAGKTFKYTSEGPVGLLENKKAVHIQASGGVYSEGPAQSMEFGNSYLKTALGFIGVTDVTSILVEGMAQTSAETEKIVQQATETAQEVARRFSVAQTTN